MQIISELLFLIPIFVSSLLGAFSQDFFEVISLQQENKQSNKQTISIKIGRLFVSTLIAVMLVGFGGSFFSMSKIVDWKILCFISFIVGFTGYRIGEWFSSKLGLLSIIGMGSLAEKMELDKEKDTIAKMKEKYEGPSYSKKLNTIPHQERTEVDHILIELEHMDKYIPRPLEDHLKKEGKELDDPFIAQIIKKKEGLREQLHEK